LKFAIKDFIEDRELKTVSPVTLTGYRRTLDEFHQYCIEKEIINVEVFKYMYLSAIIDKKDYTSWRY
jgi:integrase/recombinase XerD